MESSGVPRRIVGVPRSTDASADALQGTLTRSAVSFSHDLC
ncbi:MAG: hypothetical protein QOD88_4508 [Mycobacterium sp.]|nr:hypothetical protein [Mycobacterium sp.]